ncbi:hypothetical protein EVAR_86647_1 [Eumeta japonica]|uniref:Uncharacterized protein n=1 Tax=Eumeta variegata TaxID=151549 RepID=A0A4C1Z530_EUMVA|nr:hypothetical protein EVAR_86647_1 [Eumeta japonica]
MGSEQSQSNQKQVQRAPPVRRGHTSLHHLDLVSDIAAKKLRKQFYAATLFPNGASDSPKASGKSTSQRSSDAKKPSAMLQKRQLSLQPRRKKVPYREVVKEAVSIPTYIWMNTLEGCRILSWYLLVPTHHHSHTMPNQILGNTNISAHYGTLGLPGTRDPEILEDTRDSGGVISLLPTSWVGIGSSDGGRSEPMERAVGSAGIPLPGTPGCLANQLAADQTTLVARVKEEEKICTFFYLSQGASRQGDLLASTLYIIDFEDEVTVLLLHSLKTRPRKTSSNDFKDMRRTLEPLEVMPGR